MQKNHKTHVGKSKEELEDSNVEKVVKIDRVTKVVKGGKRLAFRSFVIVGDKKGSVGYGLGKAREVPKSIKKAIERANKDLKKVNIINNTLPHEIIGEFASTKVIMRPASQGTGIIAGSAAKIIFQVLGIKDIVAKIHGARNPINVAKATMNGLSQLLVLSDVEKARGVKLPVYIKEGAK
eukprot:COSAG01_NODE_1_length_100484_cov_170.446142_74_plen_180_part_00